jgi:hypothetical protein
MFFGAGSLVDIKKCYQADEVLVDRLATGLHTHPQAAAHALKAIVEEARCRAAAGDFFLIRDLADRADDAVEEVKAETGLPDERLAALAGLARQIFAVLAIMGGSDGRRDSGYYRAPLAHAERLDAMTDSVFRLVDLVNLIGESGNQGVGESGNQGIRESGNGESGSRGIRESGNGESGNQGIGETGNQA